MVVILQRYTLHTRSLFISPRSMRLELFLEHLLLHFTFVHNKRVQCSFSCSAQNHHQTSHCRPYNYIILYVHKTCTPMLLAAPYTMRQSPFHTADPSYSPNNCYISCSENTSLSNYHQGPCPPCHSTRTGPQRLLRRTHIKNSHTPRASPPLMLTKAPRHRAPRQASSQQYLWLGSNPPTFALPAATRECTTQ
jgi:hypothetical protein